MKKPVVSTIMGFSPFSNCKSWDGLIRSIPHALDDESVIICNDSDKRYNYVPNRRFNGEMIHGTVVIAGFDNNTGEFKSLTQEQQKKYVEKFRDRDKNDVELPR